MTRRTRRSVPYAVPLLLSLSGCASEARQGSESQAPPPAEAPAAPHERFAALERQARAEATAPVGVSRQEPPPPGLDPRQVEPLDRSDPEAPALLPLDATLARLSKGDLVEPEAAPPPPPDMAAKIMALRLYASGRAKLLAGNTGAAVQDLESASRLDPTAGAIWRELGEAQLQQGKRLAANSSFRQAVRRGLREPRPLWQLGRQAQRSGRATEAVRFLNAAIEAGPETSDPTLPFLVYADLADALTTLQCYRAVSEALEEALGFPEQFSSATRLRLEFGELLRRRGDMLRDLGDLYCRLGEYNRAAEAYARSSLSPTFDYSAAVPRLVYVSLRRGRPAEAALTVIEHIDRSRGFPDERTIALIRYLADSAGMGPQLDDALTKMRTELGTAVTPSVAGALARARAAALGADRGREAILEHLAQHPDAAAAISDLLALSAASPRDVADQAIAIVERSPAALVDAANAVLARGGSADPVLARLAERRDDASVALRATLLAKLGMKAQAAELVIGRAWTNAFATSGLECEVVLACASGRYADAEAAYTKLLARPGAPARSLARAAMALQRGHEALEILDRSLGDSSIPDAGRLDLLISAAGLCNATGRPRDAESYYRRAVAADEHDERAYGGLLRLYSPGGPLADQDKLGDTIRRIRDSAPSARVLRFAAAQELAERRLDAQAEQLLLGLLEDDVTDATAGLLLVSLWDRRPGAGVQAGGAESASLANADAWLRARTEAYPEVHWLWAARARIMAARGDAAGAEALLAQRLAVRPVDELAHTRETILRDGLAQRDEADAAALARVKAEPRTYGASVELVDLLVRADRRDEALAVLRSSIPPTLTLTDDQQATLGIMVARVASKFLERPVLTDVVSASLVEEVAARNVRLPPQLHAFRIAVLASRVDDDPGAVRAAADLGAAQHPGLSWEMYKSAALVYLQADKTARALPFLRLYADGNPTRSIDLVFQLFRAVILTGELADVQWLVENVSSRSEIEQLMRRMYRDPGLRIPDDDAKLRAEFAYRIGGQLAFQNRSALAHAAYAAALGFDPDHAWTMNDWGYQLLEEGGDFARAVTLIEDAYARLPNEANIIDSLGWVRYNQGVYLDDPGPPPREGAVTLFRKAASTELGSKNATVFDHLGDAAWAGGLKDEAISAWKKAEELGAEDLLQIRRSTGASPELQARTSAELESTRSKLRAAGAGEDPAIAKRRGT